MFYTPLLDEKTFADEYYEELSRDYHDSMEEETSLEQELELVL